jgi:hypothetical protein
MKALRLQLKNSAPADMLADDEEYKKTLKVLDHKRRTIIQSIETEHTKHLTNEININCVKIE